MGFLVRVLEAEGEEEQKLLRDIVDAIARAKAECSAESNDRN